MTDFLEYGDISCEIRGAMVPGKLKLTDDKLHFKPAGKSSSAKAELLEADKVEMVNWQRLAGSWGIRVFTKEGNLHRYAGFKDAERDRLAKFFKSAYSLDMLDRELSVKGWNWGTANFTGGVLRFEVGKSDAFELPLAYVNQCNPGKNEVTLEFHQNDDAAVMLNEMRFHIPATDLAGGEDPVEEFREQILKKASVVTTSGETIALFPQVKCLTPHGRYDIKVFPAFFHLHGKTYDYKISISSIVRIFVLPDKDEREMMVAVNVDPPIKQGNTRYHYLVCTFKVEEEETLELPFTDEELKENYDGKLQREMEGPTFELVSRILKVISGKKLMVPGSFKGQSGTAAVSCSHKTASGSIYPMERGFLFMYKPPIYIRYDEIRNVDFERSGASTKSFDIKISTNNDMTYTFSSIEKGEYSALYEYVKTKKVKVTSSGKTSKSGLSFEDKGVDHIKERYKADAQELSDDSGSLSSDDSDFNPDNLEALSAKEEYDSEPSETSSDEDSDEAGSGPEAEAKREEKRKRREEKKARKEKRASAAGGSSSNAPKRERKKKMTKLPGQPKKYMSAYFLWMNSNRESMKKEYPGLSLGDFAKKAGELWRDLDNKSEWEEKSAADRKRYEAEYAKWLEEGGKELLANAKKQARSEKRAAKKVASGGSAAPKKKSSSSAAKEASADPKGGSGGGFKSKEFIEDSESSDGGDKEMKSASSSGGDSD